MKDSTRQIVERALKAAFPMHRPGVQLTRRRKDGGYNLTFIYSQKVGVSPPTHDEIHQALVDRLVILEDGNQTKMTLDDARTRFTVKLFGIGNVRVVGVTEGGMVQYRVDGWLKDDLSQRVAVYLDMPNGESAFPAAAALHPTAFFSSSMNTDAVVPPEVKGKLLTAEEANEFEPRSAKPRLRA